MIFFVSESSSISNTAHVLINALDNQVDDLLAVKRATWSKLLEARNIRNLTVRVLLEAERNLKWRKTQFEQSISSLKSLADIHDTVEGTRDRY